MTMGTAARSGKADTVTVFLVDDHAIVRHGLASYLSVTGDIEVVGEAADGAEAVAKITQLVATNRAPDVVLLDLVMPVLDGIGVGVALQQLPEPPFLIILSGFGDAEHLRAALQAGVSGYILKSASAEAIADAIRDVSAGSLHLDPTLSASPTKALTSAGDNVTITTRERDVVALAYLLRQLDLAVSRTRDPGLDALADEIATWPNIPARTLWARPAPPDESDIVVPWQLEQGDEVLSMFTTMSTFGTPVDITLSELTIELFFAADEATEHAFRQHRRLDNRAAIPHR
jgi:DNA-binding NarL/FixJ family response regulator